jgi:hypothetical protein
VHFWLFWVETGTVFAKGHAQNPFLAACQSQGAGHSFAMAALPLKTGLPDASAPRLIIGVVRIVAGVKHRIPPSQLIGSIRSEWPFSTSSQPSSALSAAIRMSDSFSDVAAAGMLRHPQTTFRPL